MIIYARYKQNENIGIEERKVGFIVSVAHIIIWVGAGMVWWKLIGLY